MSSSLYAGVRDIHRWSASYFCSISSADNPTISMSAISLLFVLAFLLLLALGNLSLSWIIALMLNHTSMIHVVVLFLNFVINLSVTKMLSFPTVTWQLIIYKVFYINMNRH
jgi:hypothetical protein